jgi:hypothetical protein
MCSNGGLLYIVGIGGILIVCCHQIDLGEEGTTERLVGVVMDMTDGVVVRDGLGVESSVVTTGTPTIVLLR